MWDVGLALALTALVQLELWSPSFQRENGDFFGSNQLLGSVLLTPVTLAVAWRRTKPLHALVVSSAAFVVCIVATGVAPDSVPLMLPLMVGMYAVGRRCELVPAAIGAGAVTAALAVHSGYTFADDVPDEVIGVLSGVVFIELPWMMGRYVRGRAGREQELEQHNAALERERAALARVAVVEERARIGRELHDVIAHGVSVMGLQAGAAEQVLASDPDRARAPLSAIQETARVTLAELRTLLGALRTDVDEDPPLEPLPGMARLADLVEHVAGAGLTVRVSVVGTPMALPPGLDVTAYRVVQESLTNAAKHAGVGTTVDVHLEYSADAMQIDVIDDGGHADRAAAPPPGGHGLLGLQERLAIHDGQMDAGRRPGGGFAVHATLPLSH